MIAEWVAANSLSWIYGKLLDKPFNKLSYLSDKKKRDQFITDYDERMKQRLESVVIDEEIDFGGLHSFIEQQLEQSIVDCVLEKDLELRDIKKAQIYKDAYRAGAADNKIKQQWIKCYLDSVFGFIKEIASYRVDADTKVYVNTIIDEVREETGEKVASIERNIDILRQQRNSCSFAEMIRAIAPKAESENEFHYLNGKIGSWGREKEIIDRLLSFDDYTYPKNLVLVVDYAGLHARKLGEWLNYRRILFASIIYKIFMPKETIA